MNRFQKLIGAFVLGVVVAPVNAQADPPGPGKGEAKAQKREGKEARREDKDERKEMRDQRKDTRKEMRDQRKDERKEMREAGKEAREEGKEDRDDEGVGRDGDRGRHLGHEKMRGTHWKPSPEFLEKVKERHESRLKRRDEARKQYEKKWGDFAHGKPAMNEFRLHGWRMAKLQRIRLLAEGMGKDDLVKKVDALIAKEQARHDKALEKLKQGGADAKEAKADDAKKEAKADDAKEPKAKKLEAPQPKLKAPTPQPAKAAKEGE